MKSDWKQLDALTARYLDGNITGEQLEALNTLLRSSELAREHFMEMTELTVMTESILGAPETADAGIASARHELSSSLSNRGFWNFLQHPAFQYSMAFLMLVACVVAVWTGRDRSNDTLLALPGFSSMGTIEKLSGSFQLVAEDGSLHSITRSGGPLIPGNIISQSFDSYMQLRLDCGSRLEFIGNGAFGVHLSEDRGPESAKEVILYHGFLSADIAEKPGRLPVSFQNCLFRIDTTHARFLMRTGKGHGMVKVSDGAVQISKPGSGEQYPVYTAESARITPFRSLEESIVKDFGRTASFRLVFDSYTSEVLEVSTVNGEVPVIRSAESRVCGDNLRHFRMVRSIVVPISELSPPSVALLADSRLSIAGTGPAPDSLRIQIATTNGRGRFVSIYTRDIPRRRIQKASVGPGVDGWRSELSLNSFKSESILPSGHSLDELEDILSVVITTHPDGRDFNISALQIDHTAPVDIAEILKEE